MNEKALKIMLENMLFQAKQTKKDIIGLGKLILFISVVALVFFSVVTI